MSKYIEYPNALFPFDSRTVSNVSNLSEGFRKYANGTKYVGSIGNSDGYEKSSYNYRSAEGENVHYYTSCVPMEFCGILIFHMPGNSKKNEIFENPGMYQVKTGANIHPWENSNIAIHTKLMK